MTQDKIKKIHRWYSWILAALLAVLGVLVILSCLDIYTSGPRPYSAEAIALRFRRIGIPMLIAVAGIAGSIVLNLMLPLENQRTKAVSSPKEIMLRLRQKADVAPIRREIQLRLFFRIVTVIIFIGLMVYPVIYFLNPGHFSVSNLNADIVRAILIALIPAIAGLALCWGCQALVNASFRREAALYKRALADGFRKSSDQAAKQPQKCYCGITKAIKLSMIVIAVILIIAGIYNGGAEDVLKKAIAICTECIGLG